MPGELQPLEREGRGVLSMIDADFVVETVVPEVLPTIPVDNQTVIDHVGTSGRGKPDSRTGFIPDVGLRCID
jgi:hypothetical protein